MSNLGKALTIKDFLKSKFQHNKKSNEYKSNDYFIIKYNANNKNLIQTAELLDQRRLVFVSLCGLYRTWNKIPSVQLNVALVLVPLKKIWLYDPLKYRNEICQCMIIFEDMIDDADFVAFLKWKDFQGSVFWMLDKFKPEFGVKHCQQKPMNNQFIAPFWFYFSDKLTTLYDPITQSTYAPLKVDENWWKKLNIKSLKFSNSISLVLHELFFLTMKYKQMQEILYQSYPQSLLPITSFDEIVNNAMGNGPNQTVYVHSISTFSETDPDLIILDHYDPNDLD